LADADCEMADTDYRQFADNRLIIGAPLTALHTPPESGCTKPLSKTSNICLCQVNNIATTLMLGVISHIYSKNLKLFLEQETAEF